MDVNKNVCNKSFITKIISEEDPQLFVLDYETDCIILLCLANFNREYCECYSSFKDTYIILSLNEVVDTFIPAAKKCIIYEKGETKNDILRGYGFL